MIKTEFINIDVTAHQRVRYSDQRPDPGDMLYTLEGLVGEGFKVSMSSKPDGGGFNVSVTDRRKKSRNYNKCLSSWGSSLEELLADLALVILLDVETKAGWSEVWSEMQGEQKIDMKEYLAYIEWKRSQTNDKASPGDE